MNTNRKAMRAGLVMMVALGTGICAASPAEGPDRAARGCRTIQANMEWQSGTDGKDDIDQKALGLADWTNIYGGAGDDTIRVGVATVIGEAGDDTIIGTSPYSTVSYWNSPSGVTVNLVTGIAKDGFGGTDHLSGLRCD